MQVDEFTAQPVGLAGDAMLATVVNHVASREGPVEAAELEMIYGMIDALRDRVSPQAMMLANAKLAAIRTAQEAAEAVAAQAAAAPAAPQGAMDHHMAGAAPALPDLPPEQTPPLSPAMIVADADDLVMIDAREAVDMGEAEADLDQQAPAFAEEPVPASAHMPDVEPAHDSAPESVPEPQAEIIAWPGSVASALDCAPDVHHGSDVMPAQLRMRCFRDFARGAGRHLPAAHAGGAGPPVGTV